ncbi:MAG: hypothetical protein IJS71_10350 [Clostridia bacterium]|nr:hypothetical protein [Clostridia bacterium]
MSIAIIIIILLTLNILYLTNYFGEKRMRFVVCTLITLFCAMILFSLSVLSLYATAVDFPDFRTINLILTTNENVSVLFRTIGIMPEYMVFLLCAIEAVFWFAALSTAFVLLHLIYTITKKVIKEISNEKETEGAAKRPREAIGYAEVLSQKPMLSLVCRFNC